MIRFNDFHIIWYGNGKEKIDDVRKLVNERLKRLNQMPERLRYWPKYAHSDTYFILYDPNSGLITDILYEGWFR